MSVGIEVEQRIDQLDDSVDVDGNLLVLSLLKVAVGTKLLEIGIFDLCNPAGSTMNTRSPTSLTVAPRPQAKP